MAMQPNRIPKSPDGTLTPPALPWLPEGRWVALAVVTEDGEGWNYWPGAVFPLLGLECSQSSFAERRRGIAEEVLFLTLPDSAAAWVDAVCETYAYLFGAANAPGARLDFVGGIRTWETKPRVQIEVILI